MSTRQDRSDAAATAGVRDTATRTTGATLLAFQQLAGGLGTALWALAVLTFVAVVAVTSVLGIGLLLVPLALRAVHAVADRERARLGRWGAEIIGPGPLPTRLREAAANPTTRRQLQWLLIHATWGLLAGIIGVFLPIYAVRDMSFPLWWKLLPPGETSIWFWEVDSWLSAFSVALVGVGWLAITVGFLPTLARLEAWPGRRLLPPGPEVDLSLRVAELTATRAAALDAHATELRRIERSLHDGTQNRLVAVTVLLGAARRMVDKDPTGAKEVLERAQSAAEQALAELRAVSRGILPPVLDDRGLAGALTGLAASSLVPCRLDVDLPRRCAASVEATAYFVVAEALTNIARHSGARQATVTVRIAAEGLTAVVTDNGHGGAEEGRGSGLLGIRRRVAAHDGTLVLTSPPGGPTTLHVELPCGS